MLSSCRRATARAINKLAMLAQAMSSTMATTTSKAVSGCSYRPRSEECPAPAGVSVNGSWRYGVPLPNSGGIVAERICAWTA